MGMGTSFMLYFKNNISTIFWLVKCEFRYTKKLPDSELESRGVLKPVKDPQWSFFVKIVNGHHPLTNFEKKIHHRCLIELLLLGKLLKPRTFLKVTLFHECFLRF